MINPLIVFSNAYDCKPVMDALETLPCDQLHMNYFPYPQNYLKAREKFLYDPEFRKYTHYVVASPDLVPVKEDFEKMCEIVEREKYPVYGPCCNVDKEENKDRIAACLKLPELPYSKRLYRFVSESQRKYMLEHDTNIIDVKFNGLTFAFISREMIEKMPFTKLPYPTDERPIWESRGGYACDLAFCHYCDYMKIPIRMDLRFKWEHLRYWGELQVGKKTPTITFLFNKKK